MSPEDLEYYELVQICLLWRHSTHIVDSSFTETNECNYKDWKIIRHKWKGKGATITYVGIINNFIDLFKELRENDSKISYYFFMGKNRIEDKDLNTILHFIDSNYE